jgi:hypothetical protein
MRIDPTINDCRFLSYPQIYLEGTSCWKRRMSVKNKAFVIIILRGIHKLQAFPENISPQTY